jgi:hypothetical protein
MLETNFQASSGINIRTTSPAMAHPHSESLQAHAKFLGCTTCQQHVVHVMLQQEGVQQEQ